MFFSSHVLSDAEALCSRVAILAREAVANGRLSDILPSASAAGSSSSPTREDLIAKHKSRIASVHAIGAGRFTLELPASAPPEALLAELTAEGARLVSLNPMRETLEDFFVEKVRQGAGPAK